MKNIILITAAATLAIFPGANADLCAIGRTEINGNWFCQPVQAIRYTNVGASGSYKQITNMAADGTCASRLKHFNGPLSPLDEEVSFHFRGPLHLKQFAAYTPSTNKKRKWTEQAQHNVHQRREVQDQHNKKRTAHEEQKRSAITATIDGQVVSWENNAFEKVGTQMGPASKVIATINGQVVSWDNDWFGTRTGTTSTKPTADAPISPTEAKNAGPRPSDTAPPAQNQATKGGTAAGPPLNSDATDKSLIYERIGYYHSASQTVDNLVFLGNHGGQGSGVFDLTYGASLAYSNCDGTGGAPSPQILADKVIPSNVEVIVMLAQQCANVDCGYVRPGTVAHHGFGGADKVFFVEFSMPTDGSIGFNSDMPAIWLLNAQIPRTLQYGKADCSCWKSGCGEFDIAEALFSGSTYLKSTLHTNAPGGDSDYLVRPTSGTMRLAVVFSSDSSTVHIQVLPDGADFPETLTANVIDRICGATAQNIVSHFSVS